MKRGLLLILIGAFLWGGIALEAPWMHGPRALYGQADRHLVRQTVTLIVNYQLQPRRPHSHRRFAGQLFRWLWETRTGEEQAIIELYLELRGTERQAILR